LLNWLPSRSVRRTNHTRPRRNPWRFALPRLERLEDRTLLAANLFGPGGNLIGIFPTIQGAVNAADPSGDTIKVDPGTYTEQVTINKSLTLQGNGAGAIIQAPSTMTPDPVFNLRSLVEVKNAATVNINNMTIEGPNPAINDGILVVGGATANVTGSTIVHIHQNTATFGNQTGFAIQVGGTGAQAVGQVGNATIIDCTITDYQKVGVIIGRNGSSGTVTGSTITGIGPTPLNAQNGIQISPGAGSSTVSNNTISGNQYTGSGPPPAGANPFTTTQAAGILDLTGPNSIAGNTVVNNDIGIDSTNSVMTGPGTTISGNTVQGSSEGILLDQGTATVSNNTIAGNNIGVLVVAFAGNTINSQGTLVSNNITNNGNVSVGFAGGGIVLANETGATRTAMATAHFNRIVGNRVGLNNETTTTADAINNWWGSNAGPGGAVSGPVTDNPWLVLQVTASPTTLLPGGVATVVADMTKNSSGLDTSALGHVPDGIPVSFAATNGTINPTVSATVSGKATATFTATTPGTATVSATVDNQTSSAPINILSATTIQLTTLNIVPNLFSLTALVTLTAQVSNPAGTVNEGLVTFTLAGMSVQGTVHNGTANAQVVIPLLSLLVPMNIPASYADNSLPPLFGPGNAVTPVVFNLLNLLLPSVVTLTPGGGEQNVMAFPFVPLVFSYFRLPTFFGAVVLETFIVVPVQAFFFGRQGQFLGVVP
jgi:hypothetical protein